MKTELIYSRNSYEDIKLAIDEIQSFRQAYLPVIDPQPGNGQSFFTVLAGRLQLLFFPMRFRNLQDADDDLKKLCNELEELAELVQISNLMQQTYAKYNGKMDVRVKASGKHDFKLTLSTGGYSDDIGLSGSVRIPPIKREFILKAEAVDKCFSRGIIDFSWIDARLNEVCGNISRLQNSMPINRMPAAYTPAVPALPDFKASGESPRDILE